MNTAFSKDFSVLLAVCRKDKPALFRKALGTVFSNSLQPEELLVVADGDLTEQLLLTLNSFAKQHPLRLLKLTNNVGLAKALNEGLATIKTEYTIRADADDFNYPERFKILVAKLREGFDLVGSAVREVDNNGNPFAFRSCPLTEEEIRKFARRRNPFNHMTVGFRTAAVLEAGGYPSIYLKEDYALWATLLRRGCRVCNLGSVLVDATAGAEMFKRRGGVRYAIAEVDLQRHLVICGLKTPLSALADGLLRMLVFLAPNTLRQFVYLKFLRRQQERG